MGEGESPRELEPTLESERAGDGVRELEYEPVLGLRLWIGMYSPEDEGVREEGIGMGEDMTRCRLLCGHDSDESVCFYTDCPRRMGTCGQTWPAE